jgi:diguanylate cyclase (GGDEF)-like protein
VAPNGAEHILVVEDEPVAREALATLLGDEGYRVTAVRDGLAALDVVKHDPPALVLSDVRMPRADGFDLVRRLRARATTAHIPILLISALAAPERRVRGLDLGADDFLAKPVDFGELLARVRMHLRRVRERRELEQRALVDGLTGVLNRRGITIELEREIRAARHGGRNLCVLMVDIDAFKRLNDEHGHQAGDTALRHVANALVGAVRTVDRVGRYGGDEFLLVIPDTDPQALAALAGRLRTLRLPRLAVDPEREVDLTISIGPACLHAGERMEDLIARADRAMYRVKRTGELPVAE